MNRTYLEGAAEVLATKAGYLFYAAPESQMFNLIKGYPAAWLAPLELQSVEGRRHGQATYTITLHLLQSAATLSPQKRLEMLASMELQAIEIFTSLSLDGRVLSVEALSIKPPIKILTPHGDIAISVTARVVTRF